MERTELALNSVARALVTPQFIFVIAGLDPAIHH
jgi:hypothetical protein